MEGKRKVKIKRPTIRQQKTLRNLDKGMSMGEAMRRSGYKENYARNPNQLRDKESFQAMLKKYFPPELVAQKHQELLNSAKVETFTFPESVKKEDIEEIMLLVSKKYVIKLETVSKTDSRGVPVDVARRWVVKAVIPNGQDLKAALDMVYKLSGDYSPEKIDLGGPLAEASDEELWEQARRRGLFNNKK